jgi:ABC-2 type transport system permease protein
MNSVLVLLRKDFAHLFRNRSAVLLTFIIPFVMIYVFGQIFGVNRKDSGPNRMPLAVVNASDQPAAAKFLAALQAEKSFRIVSQFINPDRTTRPLTEADARALMQATDPAFRFALVIPADLISPSQLGLHLKILSNPRNEIETQTVNGLLQKNLYAHVPELLGQSLQARAQDLVGAPRLQQFNATLAGAVSRTFGGDPTQIERSLAAGDFGLNALTARAPSSDPTKPATDVLARLIRLETEQVVGATVKSPFATAIIGGWAIQFLLFALSASATSLFRERDAGILQRLLASPVTRAQILWSKFLYGVCLGLLQLLVLFFAGSMLYGIELQPHLGKLILVCVFAAAACTSFGMFLAAVSSSPEAANGLATFLIMLMSALGGAWFPISLMPDFMQQFSKLTLVYWSMEGFSAVLWAGQSLVQILPILAILGGITTGVMTLAIWRFNRGKIFG